MNFRVTRAPNRPNTAVKIFEIREVDSGFTGEIHLEDRACGVRLQGEPTRVVMPWELALTTVRVGASTSVTHMSSVASLPIIFPSFTPLGADGVSLSGEPFDTDHAGESVGSVVEVRQDLHTVSAGALTCLVTEIESSAMQVSIKTVTDTASFLGGGALCGFAQRRCDLA